MQEIANRFKEEYTELLSRYKEDLTNAQIMSILQYVTPDWVGQHEIHFTRGEVCL